MFEYLQDESVRDLIENAIIAFLVCSAFYDSWRIYRAEAALEKTRRALIKLQGRTLKTR